MGIHIEHNVVKKDAWTASQMNHPWVESMCRKIDVELKDFGFHSLNIPFSVFNNEREWFASIEALRREYENAGWTVKVNYYTGRFAAMEIA